MSRNFNTKSQGRVVCLMFYEQVTERLHHEEQVMSAG